MSSTNSNKQYVYIYIYYIIFVMTDTHLTTRQAWVELHETHMVITDTVQNLFAAGRPAGAEGAEGESQPQSRPDWPCPVCIEVGGREREGEGGGVVGDTSSPYLQIRAWLSSLWAATGCNQVHGVDADHVFPPHLHAAAIAQGSLSDFANSRRASLPDMLAPFWFPASGGGGGKGGGGGGGGGGRESGTPGGQGCQSQGGAPASIESPGAHHTPPGAVGAADGGARGRREPVPGLWAMDVELQVVCCWRGGQGARGRWWRVCLCARAVACECVYVRACVRACVVLCSVW
jgi:hypothetical protein